MKLAYTADQVGDYVVPVSTVLTQSMILDGDELFPAILSQLRRLYPEVYSLAIYLVWVTAHREFLLGEDGDGLSGGNLSDNRFSKLGAYAGRFDNIIPSIARMNNPSPSLTNVYIDTPTVGPTLDPLEYAPPSRPPWEDSWVPPD